MPSLSLNIALFYKSFILGFGLAGNITIIFIMRRTKTPITTRIILILLAISDSAYLIMNTPDTIVIMFFKKTFSDLSDGTCKLAIFSYVFFPSISAWLVAILTTERCFAVLIPLSVKRVVTKERLIVFLVIFVSIYLGWNCFIAYHANLQVNYYGVNTCMISETISVIFSTVTIVCDLIIPLLIVLIGNIIISCLIVIRRRNYASSGRSKSQGEVESRLIGTMLAVSFTFVVLSTPITIYYTLGKHLLGYDIFEQLNYFLIADCLTYTNFGINFYLYICFSKSFRELVKITNQMKCCKRTADSAQSISVAQTELSFIS